MSTEYIHETARRLIRKFDTRNPFEIADAIGIRLKYNYEFTTLKGMYRVIERNRFIILNGNLRDNVKRLVCAHEIGHDALHRNFAVNNVLKEFMLYDMETRPEYEANVFAGELLLDDKEIYTLARDGYDIPYIAGELGTDYNLLLIKMNEMVRKGYDLRLSMDADSRFLGKTNMYDFEYDEYQ